MVTIVGFIVVIGAILGGFTMAGGHIGALIHPSEIVTIGGAALGSMIVMSPKKVLIDMFKGIVQCIKGSPYSKANFQDMFKMMYELFRLARREGLIVLEPHLSTPKESAIFTKYPKILGDHHVLEFICNALTPVIDGTIKSEQVPGMLNTELHLIAEEHHAPQGVLTKVADALPGFGIVAAVLGIVITMEAISGPVEEIGEKVGAALVGTFMGILLSYGFVAPLATKMEFIGADHMAFFNAISSAIQGFTNDLAPKEAIEQARRSVGGEMRISREHMDELLKEVDKA
ncbi:MAG: flagellar motor stator protein MotA [Pirellulales bacterium]|nr:flagellar motor stator protein MotA [Pirellulales bacterium]